MKARTYCLTMAALILAVGPALAAPPMPDMNGSPEWQRDSHRPYQAEAYPYPSMPQRPGRPPGLEGGDRPHGLGYRPGPPVVVVPPYGPDAPPRGFRPRHHHPEGWYRPAMRAYRFCQTPRGATMILQDKVLFATDKSNLRPAALDTLEPLAAWLADNPGVQVAIDGHTDARASDAYNQTLSERRAESVHSALVDMGAGDVQYVVTGHGKREPIATNTTAAGMQLNRRVEITLLGQQAASFGGVPCR